MTATLSRRAFLWLVGLVLLVACNPGGTPPPLPPTGFSECAATGTPDLLTPEVTCAIDEGGARTIVFGYRNDGDAAVVPSGTEANRYIPLPDARAASGSIRPPSSFLPGTHPAAFYVTYLAVLGNLSWRLGSRTADSSGAPICSVVRDGEGVTLVAPAGTSNTPPSITVSRDPARLLATTIQPTQTPLGGRAVGETAGALAVSSDGSATYSVQLAVPPGRADMQPDLSLNYGSRSGNGPLGVGWNIGGISQISRCVSPRLDDNSLLKRVSSAPVDWTDADRMCLDGDPLVGELNPGLSPLHDPYTRVTVAGRDQYGPTAYIAELKNGRILTFGGPTATIEGDTVAHNSDGLEDANASKHVRYAWLLAEVRDRPGNSIRYTYDSADLAYQQGCENGGVRPCRAYEKRPKAITYTHSPSGGSAVKRVEFEWDDERPDTELAWVSGLPLKRSGRLHRIAMIGPAPIAAGPLRSYTLAYSTAPVTGRSILTSIEECDGVGACRAPTHFEYEQGSPAFSLDTVLGRAGEFNTPNANLIVADFTGDGLDDLLYQRGGAWFFRRNITSPGAPSVFEPEVALALAKDFERRTPIPPVAIDITHDGKADLVFPMLTSMVSKNEACSGAVYSSLQYHALEFDTLKLQFKGGEPIKGLTTLSCGDSLTHSYFADLDGDDRPDAVEVKVAAGDASWTVKSSEIISAPAPLTVSPLTVPLNGSRSWSFLAVKSDRYHLAGPSAGHRTPFLGTANIAFGDMNLDGAADGLMRVPGTKEAVVLASVGSSFRRIDVPMPTPADGFSVPWPSTTSAIRVDYFEDGRAAWIVDPDMGSPSQQLTTPMLKPNGLHAPEWVAAPPIASGGTVADLKPSLKMSRIIDANGDGLEDLLLLTNGEYRIYKRDGRRADVLTSVRTGHGDTTRIEYRAVLAGFPDLFPGECGVSVGVSCGTRGVHVVARVERHSGWSPRSTRYEFSRASTDFASGTFLGYASTSEVDEQTGTRTTKNFFRRAQSYHEDGEGGVVAWWARRFPFANAPTMIEVQTPLENGRILRNVTTIGYGESGAFGVQKSIDEVRPPSSRSMIALPRTIRRVSQEIDAVTRAVRSTIHESDVEYKYDRYGNVEHTVSRVASVGQKTTTENSWLIDRLRWLISLPQSTTEESEVVTPFVSGKVKRTTTYDPDPLTGLLRGATLEPSSGPASEIRLAILRNGAGQVVSTIASDTAGAARRSDVAYDDIDGTFPVRTIDAMGYVTSTLYHPGLGVLAESTDPNGVRRRFRYDGFGHIRRVLAPQCTQGVDLTGKSCSGSSAIIEDIAPTVSGAVFAVRASALGSPSTTVNYDGLGRVVRTDTTGFDGNLVSTLATYDRVFLDLPSTITEVLTPSPTPESFFLSRTTSLAYDRAGRLIRRTAPDKSFATWSYDGRFSTTHDAVGAEVITEHDALGRVVRILEDLHESPAGVGPIFTTPGGSRTLQTHYRYGPFGQLVRIVDPDGNQTAITYDVRGRRRSFADRDTGLTEYSYDAFGQLTSETDAMGRVREFAYDPLGRAIGSRATDGVSCFQYDASPNGIGRLALALRTDGAGDARITTKQSMTHDLLGRVASKTQTVGDGPALTFSYSYDELGRPSQVGYPGVGGAKFAVAYGYNVHGYLDRVADFTTPPASGAVSDAPMLWQWNAVNAVGQLTKETFGSGVSTTHSYMPNTGLLDRTIARTTGGSVVQDLSYEWYLDRRLKRRTDRSSAGEPLVDGYTYDSLKRLKDWSGAWGSVQYSYDDIGNLERRVTNAAGIRTDERFASGKASLPLPGKPAPAGAPIHAIVKGPEGAYTYNDVGDQESAPGRTIAWTSFHLPRRIVGEQIADYSYDAWGHRVRKAVSGGATTTYAGGLYELRESAGGVENVYTVDVGGRAIAQISRVVSPGGGATSDTVYFHADHLGSPHAITDGKGVRIGLRKHEPFGRRVSPTNPMVTPAEPVPGLTRAFTGHEQEDELGLVNMRGRIYDPGVGRFLSADPIVGSHGQSLNRFSYVGNDPINATDPTGLCGDNVPCPPAGSEETKHPDGFGGEPRPAEGEPSGPGPQHKPPPPPPTSAPPKPGTYVPLAPINGGVGGVTPFGLAGFAGFKLPTLGSGHKLAGVDSPSKSHAAAGLPIEGGTTSSDTPRLSSRRFAGARYESGASVTPDKSWFDKEWIDYNAAYSPNRILTKHGERAAYGSLWVASKASEIGLAIITMGGSNVVLRGAPVVVATEGAAAVEAPLVARGPAATRELATEIANVETLPMNVKRTVVVIETAEGPTIVAGGASDLSAAQIAAARAKGLTPVPAMPGAHAEVTGVFGAGELGLTPTRGVTTNVICSGPGGCRSFIEQLGGRVTSKRSFEF